MKYNENNITNDNIITAFNGIVYREKNFEIIKI